MSARSYQPGQWLDPAAAAVPAAAAAWSATLIGPLFDLTPSLASGLSGLVMFAIGWWLMRRASPRSAPFALRIFRPPVEPDADLLDQADRDAEADAPMFDQPRAELIGALAELLLDDPLDPPRENSRVVQLFPPQPMPTAGELQRRIDVHLGMDADTGGDNLVSEDATDSLRRALDELRQTLARR